MNRYFVMVVLLVGVLAGWAELLSGSAYGQAGDPVYRFDPALSVEKPSRMPTLTSSPSLLVNKDKEQGLMRVQTDTSVAPYLGAERAPELSAEELRLLPGMQDRHGLQNYRLEAGVGLFVEDKASVNLGYRFHSQPSLLDERRDDPLTMTGDVRISFDIKVPFD